MPRLDAPLDAIVFDFGNTLIAFGQAELRHIDGAMMTLLEDRFGPLDRDRFLALRHEDRLKPYRRENVESDLRDLFTDHIRTLYGTEPDESLLTDMAQCRFDSFISAIAPLPYALGVIESLAPHFKLAIVSNYPDGNAIREGLRKVGLLDFFEVVIVSGDVGLVKPHADIFTAVIDELGVARDRTLHVGDNWLADVQGAKRSGVLACHVTQWDPPEAFERQPGDHEPDLVIEHLTELVDAVTPKINSPANAESGSDA